MRVVLTGGDGFVGRWMCKVLTAEGFFVSAWVRRLPSTPLPGVHYRVQDVRDGTGCDQAMREDSPHQVFHLAAVTRLDQAREDPNAAQDTNIRGTRNVMAAVPTMATAVLASTCHVYGAPSYLPMDEDHPCAPVGVYACSKLEAETVAMAHCENVVIARAFNHTGPGQSTRYALADWAAQIAAGGPIQTGDLSLRRDYSDVRDICAGYQLLASRGVPHRVYNLCTGEAPTLRTLLEGMAPAQVLDIEEVSARHRKGDVMEIRGDPTRAEALGWTRRVLRAEMLRDLAAAV